jgi:hypothetical protein
MTTNNPPPYLTPEPKSLAEKILRYSVNHSPAQICCVFNISRDQVYYMRNKYKEYFKQLKSQIKA